MRPIFKKTLRALLLSIIQMFVLMTTHDILYHFYPIQHRSIGFGITLFYTAQVFAVILGSFNLYLTFSKINRMQYVIVGLCLIFTSSLLFQSFDTRPLRSLLGILMMMFGYISSLVIIQHTAWVKEHLSQKEGQSYLTIRTYK